MARVSRVSRVVTSRVRIVTLPVCLRLGGAGGGDKVAEALLRPQRRDERAHGRQWVHGVDAIHFWPTIKNP